MLDAALAGTHPPFQLLHCGGGVNGGCDGVPKSEKERELRCCVEEGNVDAVVRLLKGGSQLCKERATLAQLLGDACRKGHVGVVEALLTHGAPADGGGTGILPLHLAAQEGHGSAAAAVLRALVAYGRSAAFAVDAYGEAAVGAARRRGFHGVALKLEQQVEAQWPPLR